MVLTRWAPIYEIRRARRLANRRWAGFPSFFSENSASTDASDASGRRDWSIPLDIVRDGDNVTVKASLPGVNPEDIDVTVEGGVLTIKAATEVEEAREDGGYVVRERRTGSFHRRRSRIQPRQSRIRRGQRSARSWSAKTALRVCSLGIRLWRR